ncbi:hypothetical protein BDQ17DRAFT_1380477 [Cyathus striatus]|nr:hypothetical protein BDQ17DRAFT_1380477 [Cyathus striatus]
MRNARDRCSDGDVEIRLEDLLGCSFNWLILMGITIHPPPPSLQLASLRRRGALLKSDSQK